MLNWKRSTKGKLPQKHNQCHLPSLTHTCTVSSKVKVDWLRRTYSHLPFTATLEHGARVKLAFHSIILEISHPYQMERHILDLYINPGGFARVQDLTQVRDNTTSGFFLV